MTGREPQPPRSRGVLVALVCAAVGFGGLGATAAAAGLSQPVMLLVLTCGMVAALPALLLLVRTERPPRTKRRR